MIVRKQKTQMAIKRQNFKKRAIFEPLKLIGIEIQYG